MNQAKPAPAGRWTLEVQREVDPDGEDLEHIDLPDGPAGAGPQIRDELWRQGYCGVRWSGTVHRHPRRLLTVFHRDAAGGRDLVAQRVDWDPPPTGPPDGPARAGPRVWTNGFLALARGQSDPDDRGLADVAAGIDAEVRALAEAVAALAYTPAAREPVRAQSSGRGPDRFHLMPPGAHFGPGDGHLIFTLAEGAALRRALNRLARTNRGADCDLAVAIDQDRRNGTREALRIALGNGAERPHRAPEAPDAPSGDGIALPDADALADHVLDLLRQGGYR